jgi:hypothetical protein
MEKRRSRDWKRRFQMGVDQPAITARGTALVCLPVDRPHDPGDAADLSIMGYLCTISGTLSGRGQNCAKRKENQHNLNLEPNPSLLLVKIRGRYSYFFDFLGINPKLLPAPGMLTLI